jgi:hypothetical protein
MPHQVLPLLETLFHAEKPSGKTLVFRWRLVTRHGRPLLLLPEDSMDFETGLELYSAQRRRAKIWRATLPKLLRSPAKNLFQHVTFRADADSAYIKFLAEQSGLTVGNLRAPAIKFGGLGQLKMRLAVLVCDATNRPTKVIKVGLNPAGRATTEREADMLAQLPANVIGCIRMSGRMRTEKISIFATSFFPGESPMNDAGMEILFQSWLNEKETIAVDDFESWHELASAIPAEGAEKFRSVRAALTGQKIRSTLYHGDFTPWNLRAVNALNLQAYDWEGGFVRGIPGWDWFHFFVQTSILVKRHSPERVAAELDQLLQSPRFQKYAQAASIEKILEPLLLAYLLHQKYVVQPLEGTEVTDQLLDYLWTHWQGKLPPPAVRKISAPANAWAQIRFALGNLANLFWQPTLTHEAKPTLTELCQKNWKSIIISTLWFLLMAHMPLWTDPHLTFAPFYLIPCIYFALRVDRRLAIFFALAGAFAGPMIFYHHNPTLIPLKVIWWNSLMRLGVFQTVVVIFDRVRRQNVLCAGENSRERTNPLRTIYGNWAIVLLTIFFLFAVVAADYLTDANILMMGFYMLPCLTMTLALGSRWGTGLALICAVLGPLLQRNDPGYQPLDIELWNTAMRFVMYETMVLFIERIRRENILFNRTPPPDNSAPRRLTPVFA